MEFDTLIKNALKELPRDLQQAIAGVDIDALEKTVSDIGLLSEEQVTALHNELLFVFLGLDEPRNLATNISHHVGIARERAERLAKRITEEMLVPHADLLEAVFAFRNEHTPDTEPDDAHGDEGPAMPHANYTPPDSSDPFSAQLTQPRSGGTERMEQQPEINPTGQSEARKDPYRESIE